MKPLIIIPTYNEAENIENIINECFAIIDNASILVVDDSSPDGTNNIVKKLQDKYNNLFIIVRNKKSGLASAYIDGFKWGLEKDYDVFVELDADFSHNPNYLPQMLEKIKEYDVVIGSRNVCGGDTEGWPWLRTLISEIGSLYSRLVLKCKIKDLTGGFNIWRRQVIEQIDLNKIISKGFMFQIEMKYKAYISGASIYEFPIKFVDRQLGSSKMNKRIFLEALIGVWKLKFWKNN